MSIEVKVYIATVTVVLLGVVGFVVAASGSPDPTKVTTPHEYAMAQGQMAINEHCAPNATPIAREFEFAGSNTDGIWYRYEDYHTDATIGWVGFWYSFSDGTQQVTDEEREEIKQTMIGTECLDGTMIPAGY